MREQFEEWLKAVWPKALTIKYNSGDYRSETVQQSWVAWQASREAVVVELPLFLWPYYNVWKPIDRAYREAIEAQGLKVKP